MLTRRLPQQTACRLIPSIDKMATVIFLLITMAFSAFFSGMELAFVSVDKLRFEMERKSGVTSRCVYETG